MADQRPGQPKKPASKNWPLFFSSPGEEGWEGPAQRALRAYRETLPDVAAQDEVDLLRKERREMEAENMRLLENLNEANTNIIGLEQTVKEVLAPSQAVGVRELESKVGGLEKEIEHLKDTLRLTRDFKVFPVEELVQVATRRRDMQIALMWKRNKTTIDRTFEGLNESAWKSMVRELKQKDEYIEKACLLERAPDGSRRE